METNLREFEVGDQVAFMRVKDDGAMKLVVGTFEGIYDHAGMNEKYAYVRVGKRVFHRPVGMLRRI